MIHRYGRKSTVDDTLPSCRARRYFFYTKEGTPRWLVESGGAWFGQASKAPHKASELVGRCWRLTLRTSVKVPSLPYCLFIAP